MLRFLLAAPLIVILPGAALFRLPFAHRERRARLDAEERAFWYLMTSVAWSLAMVMVLAAAGAYRLDRLLWLNAALVGGIVASARGRLRYRGDAPAASWRTVLPLLLLLLGVWRFFPPAEYIIGGKDPGVYINTGIQMAERGSLSMLDPVVANVPEATRDLFFPNYQNAAYYSSRFMGFFLIDPATGQSIPQFPHLFPASIAVGYGLLGLIGARGTVGAWAMLGLLAVYFTGVRLFGRPAAFAASALLALCAAEVWFARYPSGEVAVQALLLAGLLALGRSRDAEDTFFAAAAGVFVGLLPFLHPEYAILAFGGIGAAIALDWVVRRQPPPAAFAATLAVLLLTFAAYVDGPRRVYLELPANYLLNLPSRAVGGGLLAAAGLLGLFLTLRRRRAETLMRAIPLVLVAGVLIAAAYALVFRHPAGKLTDYDAYALRTFAAFYLSWAGLGLALIGFALVVSRNFWRASPFVLTFVVFSLALFYKLHIVPNHFWIARRFLPIILPGALLFAAGAALAPVVRARLPAWLWRIAGAVLVVWTGSTYLVAAAPLLPHVEYRGLVAFVERLAAEFSRRDLVLIESRDSGSDIHVLATPLACIYGRNVLVLASPRPDKTLLRTFLADALTKYDHVFFVGGGGTDLLSRRIGATPVTEQSIGVPEYEQTPWNVYPRAVRRKDFEYSVYQLALGQTASASGFVLDVGHEDDVNVVRFHGKEKTEGRTIRWTGPTSYVAIPGMTGHEKEVVLVMHDGGRPHNAPPARVTVYFNTFLLGTIDVGSGFRPYRLALPANAAIEAATMDDPAQLKLVSTVWNPHTLLGLPDDRTLGVMVDRVEVH